MLLSEGQLCSKLLSVGFLIADRYNLGQAVLPYVTLHCLSLPLTAIFTPKKHRLRSTSAIVFAVAALGIQLGLLQ